MTMDELKTAANALKAIDQIREMIRERDRIKKTAKRAVIAAGIIAVVGAGAYAIYRFVVKRNKAEAPENEICGDDEACICDHAEKAEECVCSGEHHESDAQDAACEAAAECDEAAKEN